MKGAPVAWPSGNGSRRSNRAERTGEAGWKCVLALFLPQRSTGPYGFSGSGRAERSHSTRFNDFCENHEDSGVPNADSSGRVVGPESSWPRKSFAGAKLPLTPRHTPRLAPGRSGSKSQRVAKRGEILRTFPQQACLEQDGPAGSRACCSAKRLGVELSERFGPRCRRCPTSSPVERCGRLDDPSPSRRLLVGAGIVT